MGAFPDRVAVPNETERGLVIVLAGSGEAATDFEFLVLVLTTAGYRVAVFDDTSLEPQAARVGATAEVMAFAGDGPVVVVGSDVGAVIAARLAVELSDRIDAVVLASVRMTGHAVDADSGFHLPLARSVEQPTLVFHGDSDDITDVTAALAWAVDLPFGSLRIVQRGDHRSLSSDERRTVVGSVLLFVERQARGVAILSDATSS